MVIPPQEINELKTFFSSVKVPRELLINNCIKYNNLPQFIAQVLEGLSKPNYYVDKIALCRWEDLWQIRKALA